MDTAEEVSGTCAEILRPARPTAVLLEEEEGDVKAVVVDSAVIKKCAVEGSEIGKK